MRLSVFARHFVKYWKRPVPNKVAGESTNQEKRTVIMASNAEESKVDMLAEAREAQWSALTFMGSDTVKALAPAKVNLFLGIGDKLPNGYHEVVTVLHALALHDVLYFACHEADSNFSEASDASRYAEENDTTAFTGPGGCIKVHIEVADKTPMSGAGFGGHVSGTVDSISIKDNLVFKAIDALAHELGISRNQEIDVRIEKHVPSQAGLGGGSSDAAATLMVMSDFWNNSEAGPTIRKVAASLGADVSFFLEGGCAFFTGIGEAFERELAPMKHSVVIVKPDAGISTVVAYSKFDEAPIQVPAEMLAQVDDAFSAEQVPLFNNLQPVACQLLPEIGRIVEWLNAQDGVTVSRAGEPSVLMSGSGSAVFAIVDTYSQATKIAADAAANGWWSRATSLSSLKASVL